jgi:hypothetical protein
VAAVAACSCLLFISILATKKGVIVVTFFFKAKVLELRNSQLQWFVRLGEA